MSHTPGPWSVVPRLHEESLCAVMGADGHLVVNLGDGGNGIETQRSNAALIAAAPEMLEALYSVRDGYSVGSWERSKIDNVITKAEPQEQKADTVQGGGKCS